MLRAPHISGRITTVSGTVALIATIGGAAALILAVHRRTVDARWLAVVGALMGAGGALGAIVRVVTAGVVGANIGGGLAIIFGGGFTAVLVVGAAIGSWWIVRHPPARSMDNG